MSKLTAIDELVLHPLLSGAISILFVIGVANLSRVFQRKVLKSNCCYVWQSLFFSTLGLLGVIATASLQVSISSLVFVKILAFVILAFGLHGAVREIRQAGTCLRLIDIKHVTFSSVLIILFLFFSLLINVGPPTDADSLDYHLGVGVHLIKFGELLFPRPDWFHSSLTGVGEYLNLYGLLLGTDNIGSIIQWTSILIVLNTIRMMAGNSFRDMVFLQKCFLSLPVLLFLVTSQKHQLVGTAALFSGFVGFYLAKNISKKEMFFILASLFFAMSVKLSFYLAGGLYWLFYLFKSSNSKKDIGQLLLLSLVTYGVWLLPVHMINFLNYQNPLHPFLSSELSQFTQYLRNYSEGFGFPLGVILPSSIGSYTTVLGLAPLLFLFLVRSFKGNKALLILIACTLVAGVVLGQKTSRFFIEPYLLLLLLLTQGGFLKFRKFVDRVLSLQLCLNVVMLVGLSVHLLPGTFSWAMREKVMRNHSYGYNTASWANNLVPASAVVFTHLRSVSLLKNKFITTDLLKTGKLKTTLEAILKKNQLFYLGQCSFSEKDKIKSYLDLSVTKSLSYRLETRNPFNAAKGRVCLYKLKVPG